MKSDFLINEHGLELSLSMGVEPKNSFFFPQIIHLFIGFSNKKNPFWGTIIFGNTHMIDENKNTQTPEIPFDILPWIHPPRMRIPRHHHDMTS